MPCECGKCYFCLHEMTNGIAHKGGNRDRVVVYANGVRIKTKRCTVVRVNLGRKDSSYCRMCYRKQNTSGLNSETKKANFKTSTLGCASCLEPICKFCWKEGYDLHN